MHQKLIENNDQLMQTQRHLQHVHTDKESLMKELSDLKLEMSMLRSTNESLMSDQGHRKQLMQQLQMQQQDQQEFMMKQQQQKPEKPETTTRASFHQHIGIQSSYNEDEDERERERERERDNNSGNLQNDDLQPAFFRPLPIIQDEISTLEKAKSRLKQEIKDWMTSFEQEHGRRPTNLEKKQGNAKKLFSRYHKTSTNLDDRKKELMQATNVIQKSLAS